MTPSSYEQIQHRQERECKDESLLRDDKHGQVFQVPGYSVEFGGGQSYFPAQGYQLFWEVEWRTIPLCTSDHACLEAWDIWDRTTLNASQQCQEHLKNQPMALRSLRAWLNNPWLNIDVDSAGPFYENSDQASARCTFQVESVDSRNNFC